MSKTKIPDAVRLAAKVLCSQRDCCECELQSLRTCDRRFGRPSHPEEAQQRPFIPAEDDAKRILRAYRARLPRRAKETK